MHDNTHAEVAMFTTLLESRPVRQRRGLGTFASALAHGTVIAVAVTMTVHHRGEATPAEPPVKPPVFVVAPESPRMPPGAPTTTTRIEAPPAIPVVRTIVLPTIVPTTLPPIDFDHAPTNDDRFVIGHATVPGSAYPGIGSPSTSVSSGGAYEVAAVDRAPSIMGTPPEPRYPGALRQNGTTGHVIIRFVVDTLGRAEMRGVDIVESTNDQFSDAVRGVLDRYRFNPGEVAGRKVRTLVQIPFTFSLQ